MKKDKTNLALEATGETNGSDSPDAGPGTVAKAGQREKPQQKLTNVADFTGLTLIGALVYLALFITTLPLWISAGIGFALVCGITVSAIISLRLGS